MNSEQSTQTAPSAQGRLVEEKGLSVPGNMPPASPLQAHLPGSGQRTAAHSPSCNSECTPTKHCHSWPDTALPFALTFAWGSAQSVMQREPRMPPQEPLVFSLYFPSAAVHLEKKILMTYREGGKGQ